MAANGGLCTHGADPMNDARSGSGNTIGSLGIITIGGAVGLVGVFFVVQCYRGWQRWSKARQSGGQLVRRTVISEEHTCQGQEDGRQEDGQRSKNDS